jgi:hypothetical protein
MKSVIVACLVASLCVGTAIAQDLGTSRDIPVKNTPIVTYEPPTVPRQGGDTIDDATVIPSLPYSITGTTEGYVDDYDEVCPYDGSTSPDVVYTFTHFHDEIFSFDLCGSSYDTKLYLYNGQLDLLACNDDFYYDDACGNYVSCIEDFLVEGGQQYYMVVDGYGGDCGEYYLTACSNPPCIGATCWDNAEHEGEPALVDGYVDEYNAGCDADDPVFQDLYPPAGEAELKFCGWTGWYRTAGVDQVDSDWFRLVASGDNISLSAEGPLYVDIECDVLYLQDCQDVSVLPFQMGMCSPGTLDIPTTPGEVVYLRVRPVLLTPPVCVHPNELYTMIVTGIASETSAVPYLAPTDFALLAITPNPFNPRTTISFFNDHPQHVRVEVYDIRGRRIAELTGQQYQAGEHSVEWNGRDSSGRAVPSGEYFFRVEYGDQVEIRKAMLLR